MAAVVVLAGGVGAFAVVNGGATHDVPVARPPEPVTRPPEPVAKPPEPVARPPEPVAKPPEPVPTAPVKVTLTISSDPAGAEVYRMPQSVRVGTTPLVYPIDLVGGEVVLLLKRPGFRDQTIAMPADHDADKVVKLVRKPASTPTRPADGTPSAPGDFLTHTPAAPTGSLDPFAKPKK
jgi:hypothetical protein